MLSSAAPEDMRKVNSEKATEKIKDGSSSLNHKLGDAEAPRKRGRVAVDSSSPQEVLIAVAPRTVPKAFDLADRTKEFVRLAREQGHLTYDDVNDVLSESAATPDDLDKILTELRTLEIEIIDPAEVDRVRPAGGEEEEGERYDILDDPVRMYLRQMGKVPLLTREQEVEICKRIEEAEEESRRIVYGLGFAAKEHIALAEKLLAVPPKERFDRIVVDRLVEAREKHLKQLRVLVKKVRELDERMDEQFEAW